MANRPERVITEVPVLNTTAQIKSATALDLVETLSAYKALKGVEVRWVRGRPVVNFTEIEGDGDDSILTLQFSPFDQRAQTGWRSRSPDSKGKYSYCPSDELVTYDVHTWDIGLDKSGNLCRIEDPSQVKAKPKARKTSHAGLPSA
jgi:hypothetical protein